MASKGQKGKVKVIEKKGEQKERSTMDTCEVTLSLGVTFSEVIANFRNVML